MHHCVSKRPKWIKKRPWMAHLNKPSRSTSCYARSSGIVVPSDKQQWYKKNRLSRKHYQTLTDKVVSSVAKCCNKKQPNYFQKLPERLPQQFLLKKCRLKLVRKVTKYLGYFCKKIRCEDVSKIAQSDHTGRIWKSRDRRYKNGCIRYTAKLFFAVICRYRGS